MYQFLAYRSDINQFLVHKGTALTEKDEPDNLELMDVDAVILTDGNCLALPRYSELDKVELSMLKRVRRMCNDFFKDDVLEDGVDQQVLMGTFFNLMWAARKDGMISSHSFVFSPNLLEKPLHLHGEWITSGKKWGFYAGPEIVELPAQFRQLKSALS